MGLQANNKSSRSRNSSKDSKKSSDGGVKVDAMMKKGQRVLGRKMKDDMQDEIEQAKFDFQD